MFSQAWLTHVCEIGRYTGVIRAWKKKLEFQLVLWTTLVSICSCFNMHDLCICVSDSLPESIMETCTCFNFGVCGWRFIWCDHSNETFLAVILHGTICFSIIFYKIRFRIFLVLWFLALLGVKELSEYGMNITNILIIQHTDTLPKYGHKTLDVVGLHDIYPTMDVNFAFWREVKMTAACNFISLREKRHELLYKNENRKIKRKGKKENYWSLDWTKRHEICTLCRSVSWWSWMKADKAGSKFSTARHTVNEGAQFSRNFCSNYRWNTI